MRPTEQFGNSFTRSQPWVNVCHDEPALKGRQNPILSPFQGSRSGELQTQGLRPGLMSSAAALSNSPSRPGLTLVENLVGNFRMAWYHIQARGF